uniref:Uncharacterized protein n=2 Tax=Spongospora subterranea TaxID=70186 RepID=A0A0H5QTE0_9EUKA|eukprot:CRZ04811.1 hypothetical protein [Spongospora subterranea]
MYPTNQRHNNGNSASGHFGMALVKCNILTIAFRKLFSDFNVPYDQDFARKVIPLIGIDGCLYGRIGYDIHSRIDMGEQLEAAERRAIVIQVGGRFSSVFCDTIWDILWFTESVKIAQNEMNDAADQFLVDQNRRFNLFIAKFVSMIDSKPVRAGESSQEAEQDTTIAGGVGDQTIRYIQLKRILSNTKSLGQLDWDVLLSPFVEYLDRRIHQNENDRVGINTDLAKLIENEIEESSISCLLERNLIPDVFVEKFISNIVHKSRLSPFQKFKSSQTAEPDSKIAAPAGELAIKFSLLQRALIDGDGRRWRESDWYCPIHPDICPLSSPAR